MLKKLISFLLFIFIITQGITAAMAGEISSPKDTWKIYSDPNQVNQIALDPKGNAWLATSGGAVYATPNFKWQVFTTMDGLASNNVQSVAVDPKGNAWFATPQGVSVRKDNGKWETYTEKNGLLANNNYKIKALKDGSVWVLNTKGINVWKNNVWAPAAKGGLGGDWPVYRCGMGISSSGKLYVVETKRIWTINAKGYFEKFIVDKDYLPDSKMLIDSKENIWLINRGKIVKVQPDKKIINKTNDFKNDSYFMDITEDPQGTIWVLTSQKIYSLKSDKWSAIAYPQELKGQVASNIYVDKNENIGLTSFSKETGNGMGVTLRVNGKWKNYRQLGPIGPQFTEVTMDGVGNLWFGSTGFHLNVRFKDNKWLNKKLNCQNVSALTSDSLGNIWAATKSGWISWDDLMQSGYTPIIHPIGGGVTEFLLNGKVKSDFVLEGYYISAMAAGPSGKVWLAVNRHEETIDPLNITLLRNDGTITKFPVKTGANAPVVQVIAAEPKGNVWFGTTKGLKLRKPEGKWQDIKLPGIKVLTEITAMALENERALWVSLRNGATGSPSDYKGQGVMVRYPDGHWQRYTMANGLLSDKVNTIYIDKYGNKWFGTDKGVSVLKFDGKWISYTVKNGLADNNVNGIIQDKNGDYWFATDAGISQLTPASGKFEPTSDLKSLKVKFLGKDVTSKWFLSVKDGRIYGLDKAVLSSMLPNGYSFYPIFKKYPDSTWKQFYFKYQPVSSKSSATYFYMTYIYYDSDLVERTGSPIELNKYIMAVRNTPGPVKTGDIFLMEEAEKRIKDGKGTTYIPEKLKKVQGSYRLTYLPIKEFFEALGYKVTFNNNVLSISK